MSGSISFKTTIKEERSHSFTMYMDTKNVESFYCSQCNLAESTQKITTKKKKGNFKKLLKPLLKKITSNNNKKLHPNNVNLNNTKDILATDYAEVAANKSCNESKTTTLNTTYAKDKVIDGLRSKPFVEYFQSKYSQDNFASFEDFQKYGKEIYIPVKYIQTEDATFFWTQTLQKIDDDLVAASVCNTNIKPVEKTTWNKTTLSLMS